MSGVPGYEFAQYNDGENLKYMKNNLDVLDSKSFKDLWYISQDLANRVEGNSAREVQYDSGDGYFSQSQRDSEPASDDRSSAEIEVANNNKAYS